MPAPTAPSVFARRTLVFGAAAAAVYTVMVAGTLAHLQALSGLVPFDMRPGGYSPAEARALIAALGAEGRAFYLARQIPLDLAYPPLLALAVSNALAWIGPPYPVRRPGRAAIWLAALADYAENAGIVAMLTLDPPSEGLIRVASAASVAKATLTTVAMTLLLIALASRAWRRRKRFTGAAIDLTMPQGPTSRGHGGQGNE